MCDVYSHCFRYLLLLYNNNARHDAALFNIFFSESGEDRALAVVVVVGRSADKKTNKGLSIYF